MNVSLSTTQHGGADRLLVSFPYHEATKNAVKGCGARWEPKRKVWHMPRTPYALRKVVHAIRSKVDAEAQFTYSEDLDPLRGVPCTIDEIEVPEFDRAVLPPWPHQKHGAAMIGQLAGSLLSWDMGSGKTKTVYDAIIEYGFRVTLVCCPLSVVSVWEREAKKHVPDDMIVRVLALRSNKSVAERAMMMRDAIRSLGAHEQLVVVVNYEAARAGPFVKEAVKHDWDCVVADECHRISNPSTATAKVLSKIGLRAKHRVGLSGTVMGNGRIDVFGQFKFIEPALFGEAFTWFKARYCIYGGIGGHELKGYQNEEEFDALMGRITTKVRIEDVVDLPEGMDVNITIDLDAETRRVYKEIEQDFISQLDDGAVTATNAITKLLRLQQATSGYASIEQEDGERREVHLGDEKYKALLEIMEDAPRDEPIVVFARFVHDLKNIRRAAMESDRPCYDISGFGNQQEEWEAECDRVREEHEHLGEGLAKSGGPVIAVQIQAGGVGIDLTKARYCVYYSLGYSLTEYLQSRARVLRPGQTRAVIYYHLVANSSVDQSVYGALRNKQKVVDAVLAKIRVAGQEAA